MASKKPVAKSKSKKPLAIALLKRDHETVNGYFKKYEKLGDDADDEKAELIDLMCSALSVHATLEEEIFYPALREALGEDGEDNLDEATIEHQSIKALVAELGDADSRDELVDARVTVLTEYVRHHVKEEEEEMFPKAIKAKNLDLDVLGEGMELRKAELVEELGGKHESVGSHMRGKPRSTQGRR